MADGLSRREILKFGLVGTTGGVFGALGAVIKVSDYQERRANELASNKLAEILKLSDETTFLDYEGIKIYGTRRFCLDAICSLRELKHNYSIGKPISIDNNITAPEPAEIIEQFANIGGEILQSDRGFFRKPNLIYFRESPEFSSGPGLRTANYAHEFYHFWESLNPNNFHGNECNASDYGYEIFKRTFPDENPKGKTAEIYKRIIEGKKEENKCF